MVIAPALLFLLGISYFAIRALVVAGGATLWVDRSSFAQGHRVYRRQFDKGQLRSEVKAAVIVVLVDAVTLVCVFQSGLAEFSAPTFLNTAVPFVLTFIWLELWFYATHRLLHTKALYFLHAQHHVAKVTHPITSLSFDVIERLILLTGAIGFGLLLSRVMPISLVGFGGYFLVNYALNVIGHMNVEIFPEGFGGSRLGKVLYSVTFHAMHHARYTGHYGLFTTVLDRAFRTTWDDYPQIQVRAARGEGLSTLGERVKATAQAS
jgi:Delta7-sterol 5-desaturase